MYNNKDTIFTTVNDNYSCILITLSGEEDQDVIYSDWESRRLKHN